LIHKSIKTHEAPVDPPVLAPPEHFVSAVGAEVFYSSLLCLTGERISSLAVLHDFIIAPKKATQCAAWLGVS